jgi:hypothetical protein
VRNYTENSRRCYNFFLSHFLGRRKRPGKKRKELRARIIYFLMPLGVAAIIIRELLINNLITQNTGDHIKCGYHLL